MAKMTKAQIKRRLQEAHNKCTRAWVSSSPSLTAAQQRRLLKVVEELNTLIQGMK